MPKGKETCVLNIRGIISQFKIYHNDNSAKLDTKVNNYLPVIAFSAILNAS